MHLPKKQQQNMRLLYSAGIALAFLVIAGCIHPYKLEIQQGNVVTREMIDRLKPGMTKSQVRFVLGTPLITDPFHPQRWDYIYVYKKNATAPAETRRITVIFDGDAMARVEGDLTKLPTGVPGEPQSDVFGDENRRESSSSSTTARAR